MAQDIAELGISVDSSDVVQAKVSLDDLAQSGAKAEKSAQGAGEAWSSAGQKVGSAGSKIGGASGSFKQNNEEIRKQQQELGKLLGQIDPVVAALDRLDKQEKQLRGFKATGAIDAETFQQFNSRIQQSRNALSVFDDSLTKTGTSAKQTQQALRQLPAQFSDIFVSLQAGQSPLTVFLQQGAQIKDSFGGIGAALRETGRFALGLVNPYTAAAAAALAIAVAWKQGSDEAVAFNKALILSGNASGVSADQLQNMAAAIDKVSGTQRQAAAALAEVAGSGKFAADQIEDVARAAVAMENATGKAVSDTVAEFKRLADEPTAAAAKLNEQYNFLTASIFDQIAALEQQGDAAGAAQLAMETFGEAMEKRSKEIEGSLGIIEQGWKSIKNVAAEAWDSMLGVGREKTLEDQLAELSSTGINAGSVVSEGAVLGPLGAAKELYDQISRQIQASTDDGAVQIEQERTRLKLLIEQRDKKAADAAAEAKRNKDSIAAQQEINKALQSTQTNAQKLQSEYKKIDDLVKKTRAGGVEVTDAQIQQLRTAAEKQFGEKPEKVRAARVEVIRDDAATKLLLSLREQQSALELQLSTSDKLTSAEKERAEFNQQISDLKSKDILTAEQQSLLANQDAIKAQLDKNVAIEQEIKLRDDALKLQDRAAQITKSIEAAQAADEEQRQRQLDSFGLGSRARKQVEEQAQIRKEFQRFQEELTRDIPADLLGSDQYKSAVQEIENSLNESLAAHTKYYDDLEKEQGDWVNGVKQSFADYIDSANDLAGQTNDLFSSALGGIEDTFVDLATTGKASFKDLADSIIADIIRIGTKLLISEALSLGGAGGGGAGGNGGTDTVGLLTSIAGLFGSFEGGGSTGPGERAGGLDGRGGFFAMLHPNETVVDHTRQSGSARNRAGNAVTIGNIDMSGVRDRREAREAAATVARQIGRVVGGSGRYA